MSEIMKGFRVHSIPFPNIELNNSYLNSDKNDRNYGHWVEVLKDYIGDWKQMYLDMFENYTSMAENYRQTRGLPKGVFEYWAITDGR